MPLPGGEDVWKLGDRGVRCYLWLDAAELTASLKGKGDKGLPVQRPPVTRCALLRPRGRAVELGGVD